MSKILIISLFAAAAGCGLGDRFKGGNTDDMSVAEDMAAADDQGAAPDIAGSDMLLACGASGQPCCTTPPACGAGTGCFNSVCTASGVWAIGAGNNTVLSNHWNGNTWSSATAITPSGLLTPIMNRLWGSSENDIWAVGSGEPVGPPSDQPPVPAVYRWQGNAWTFCQTSSACAVPSSTILTDIFGFGPSDIWVVANDGAYHWDGAAWSSKSTGMTTGAQTAQSLWCASTSDCWVVGQDSSQNVLMQHWNGTAWSAAAHTVVNGVLEGVYGFASGDVWAVGAGSVANEPLLMHWNGMQWSGTFSVPNSTGMNAVWGSASDDVWAVGSTGHIAHWNGTGWTGSTLPDPVNGYAIRGASAKDVWISAGPTMEHWDGNAWTSTMAAGQNADMRGLWGPTTP